MKLKILFVVILLALIAKLSTSFYGYESRYKNKIYPNVFIDGKDFSGKSKDQVVNFFKNRSKDLDGVAFTVIYEDQPIATFSASDLALKYDGETAADQAFLVGRSKYLISRWYQVFLSLFNSHKFNFESLISYDDSHVKDFISVSEDKYNFPAENALFKFENGKVVSFKQEKKGLSIDSEKFLKEFKDNIKKIKENTYKKEIALTATIINPEITLASSNNFGIEEEIATGKSDYTHSIPERVHNVILAASKFNGVLIPKNEVFSFNNTVGDISSQTGYQPAYIIKDGKTVLGDGGGVCQVSTTLFRAALNAGLPIVERHAHAYRVGYYENDAAPGLDATVFAPYVDLKIKNDTPAYILIETEIDKENNLLYFHFYGKKDGRKSQVGTFALWDIVPAPPPKYQDDPTLKRGVTKQIDFAAVGSKASFSYKVVDANNNTKIDQKFYSNYQPWQASFLVGTAD